MMFSCLIASLVGGVFAANTDAVNLLQHKVIHRQRRGHNSSVRNPGQRELKMCPHEIEELQQAQKAKGTPFGCRGKLHAPSTKECSWWGEPHVSATFPSQLPQPGKRYDVFYKPGHFRMAKAKDSSWEIQVFNCGLYSTAFAARFGKDIIEFIASDEGVKRYVNGKLQTGEFPIELPSGLYMDDKHRRAKANGYDYQKGTFQISSGACVDDGNSGQIYVEVAADSTQNLNIMLRAADGSFTTEAEDPMSFCNKALTPHAPKWQNWDLAFVKPEDTLFTVGKQKCQMCHDKNWWKPWRPEPIDPTEAMALCNSEPVDYDTVSMRQMCKAKDIAVQTAMDACAHLKDNEEFFYDCQIDYCTSGGNPEAVEDAEDELHQEHPAPECVKDGLGCDPVKVCCDAKKSQTALDLRNVGTNNLCGNGDGPQELRFTSVLSGVDLIVKPIGEFNCTQGASNTQNGVDGQFGLITLPVGSETEFDFIFANAGTNNPKAMDAQPVSFLDIDQGKKGKQRESVEVCGASNAIVTSNTELERTVTADCIKVTSSTHGKGDDNPNDPDNMSDIQRARTVAFIVSGSSFRATLGISPKGRHCRKFLFSGTPSIACDALAE